MTLLRTSLNHVSFLLCLKSDLGETPILRGWLRRQDRFSVILWKGVRGPLNLSGGPNRVVPGSTVSVQEATVGSWRSGVKYA
jgi:hypothetical protein